MASKASSYLKKREVAKVVYSPFIKAIIKAQMASAAPPLGPELGKRGVNVANFCKHFNKETEHIMPGVDLPTRITVKPDRTYDMEICAPTTTWLLLHAAGIRRGSERPFREFAGKISVKHIYEIAKVKSRDKVLIGLPLKDICQRITKTSLSLGIEVVREDINPEEYLAFLKSREAIVAEQIKLIAEKRAAKVLRTGN